MSHLEITVYSTWLLIVLEKISRHITGCHYTDAVFHGLFHLSFFHYYIKSRVNFIYRSAANCLCYNVLYAQWSSVSSASAHTSHSNTVSVAVHVPCSNVSSTSAGATCPSHSVNCNHRSAPSACAMQCNELKVYVFPLPQFVPDRTHTLSYQWKPRWDNSHQRGDSHSVSYVGKWAFVWNKHRAASRKIHISSHDTFAQLDKNFSPFCGNLKFITSRTNAQFQLIGRSELQMAE
jgi:hypothetical protein